MKTIVSMGMQLLTCKYLPVGKLEEVWGLGRVRSKKLFPETRIHKIFETNSSFIRNSEIRESFIFYFSAVFASIIRKLILGGGLGTRLQFYEV